LKYYVSKIKIYHDGGLITEIKDLYLLVDASNNDEYNLGTFDNINKIEGIAFGLGVDEDANHLDPTLYDPSHPLALKVPTMHWGWTSGYRFLAFEALSGPTEATATNGLELHCLGDNNYQNVYFPLNAENSGNRSTINIDANYANLLKNIDGKYGLISHASSGPSAVAMKNFGNSVFKASVSTATNDLSNQKLSVFPNPTSKELSINFPMQSANNQKISITTIEGKEVLKINKDAELLSFPLVLSSGNYMINIIENNKIIARQKLVIIE
jgi:hypothetical protein